ncbi:uncharacterized protein MONOS_10773 [Monocercomonoides exilis]|uniref:uncharacterized protein n=1 Tax=Monocercomonoides exilis TaxID=2049356 RepID=UPI00355A2A36|nr:hypothetical protein MONOS_10773 [Monocercomonoides exilis]|eukprot:MONOS_10773.1-p1 / transcript=MONOS_10773.1 / gene=MONOS_10773 / organism=Monocercomonoides_exilis_PA203 / gene_product=unspecified product / transcript_product=unspecified product / location=Mono_scaffold00504:9215-9619(+) / protein_length=135 / sequence_SO=supercontig / SO=protein_coding / is_pseudo=false
MGRSHSRYERPTDPPKESSHPDYDLWSCKASRAGRMRRETTIFKEDLVQTQVRTKTSGGETVKVIINKHPNPRIDAVVALQRWMGYTKTTFRDEHVWFDIEEGWIVNLQKIKEELVTILKENGISDTFTVYTIR